MLFPDFNIGAVIELYNEITRAIVIKSPDNANKIISMLIGLMEIQN